MEQFSLTPVSVYNSNNNSFNTQAVTKHELARYQPEQHPTYQIDSLRREINKNLFATADSSVDKTLFCTRNRFSSSQILIFEGVEIWVLLADFAQQLRRKNADVPDNFFTLLEAVCLSPTLFLNLNAKTKKKCIWFPLKIWASEGAKAVQWRQCCLWVCAQISKN